MSLTTMTLLAVAACTVTVVGQWADVAQGGSADHDQEWAHSERQKGYVVFQHSTMTNLLESHIPDRAAIVQRVSCELARGEYESLQIGVHALGDLESVELSLDSDLEVQIYRRISSSVKQQLASAPRAVAIAQSLGPESYLQRGNVVQSLAESTSTNFWLTFFADDKTREGPHFGKVRIKPAGKPETVLELEVRVRPFRLQRPLAAFGMYFLEDYLPERLLTDAATLAAYRDMAAHGQNSVTFYRAGDYRQVPPSRSRMVDLSLRLAKEAGLTHPDVPCMMLQDNISDLAPEARQRAVAWLADECEKRGWPEILEYARDEPPYPEPRLREKYAPLRSVPIRIVTAMSVIAAYGHGDLHDVWIVVGGDITPQLQAEADRLGAEVWTYSFRILREGFNPLRQRYFAGLYTWAFRLGGNFVWAYCDGYHSHIWWEPDNHEPMPVTGWEARRDGVDDYRYLQMLEDGIAARSSSAVAHEAGAWLQDLRDRLATIDPHEVEADKPLSPAEYDQIRARAAGYIEQLGPVEPKDLSRLSFSRLKDEAVAYRGQTVSDCIVGLRHDDAAARRSAAWALFEIGPAAAPAVPALAELLSDPDVRIPALRALEAVGPDAYPAAKEVGALCTDPDGFVRLGAVFTLGAMGSTPPKVPWLTEHQRILGLQPGPQSQVAVAGLQAALTDEFGPVAMTAGQQLTRFGTYAKVALPDAIGMLDNPKDEYWIAGLKIIAAMGPVAEAAVPKVIERYVGRKGIAPTEALTLAAIGPVASEAVDTLEKFATSDNSYLADTLYGLFCIRGRTSDLIRMVSLLDRTDLARRQHKRDVVNYLNALGIKGAAVVDQVRGMLKSDNLNEQNKEGLKAFLKKVEVGEGPYVVLP